MSKIKLASRFQWGLAAIVGTMLIASLLLGLVTPVYGAPRAQGTGTLVPGGSVQPSGTPSPSSGSPTPTGTLPPTATLPGTPTPGGAYGVRDMTLHDLGVGDDIILQSPIATEGVIFPFPDSWYLGGASYLQVSYDSLFTVAAEEHVALVAFFDVYVDQQRVASVALPPETALGQTLLVPLPPGTFNTAPRLYHEFEFVLNAEELCEEPADLRVIIDDLSPVHFDYTLILPVPDLSVFPRPLLRYEFDPERVLLVLPDQPSLADLEAAAAFSATIGGRAGDRLQIDVLRASEVTASRRVQSSIVAIGRPDDNSFIQELYADDALPTRLVDSPIHLELSLSESAPSTYTVTVRNTGTTASDPLTLEAVLPVGISAEQCTSDCGIDGSVVTWNIAALEAGASVETTLTLAGGQPADQIAVKWRASQGAEPVALLNSGVSEVVPGKMLYTATTAVELDEGVVQEIISPYNGQYVVLVMTGLSYDAVLKAVHGVSSTVTPSFVLRGQLAIIREVLDNATLPAASREQFTLSDLDYGDQVVYGTQTNNIDLYFMVPENWLLTDEAMARLEFSHSAALDEGLSLMTVLLNGTPVGSARLDRTNAQGGVLEIDLPAGLIVRGYENQLRVQVNMQLNEECIPPDTPMAWLTISQDSLVRLDHETVAPEQVIPSLDVFPQPFSNSLDLANVMFVLPEPSTTQDVEVVMRLSSELGSNSPGAIFHPVVTFGGLVDERELSDYHLVLLGRPTTNRLIQAVNGSLPQPFVEGGDAIERQAGEVVYRLPDGFSVGIVEVLASPYNTTRAILVVTGTTDEGYTWARRAVVDAALANQLTGDLAYVQDTLVQGFESIYLTQATLAEQTLDVLPEMRPEGESISPTATTASIEGATSAPVVEYTPTVPAQYEPVPPDRPTWLNGLTLGVGVVVLVILGGIFIRSRLRKDEE